MWTCLLNLLVVSLVDSLLFHIDQYDIFNPMFIHAQGKRYLTYVIVLFGPCYFDFTKCPLCPAPPFEAKSNSMFLTVLGSSDVLISEIRMSEGRWLLAFEFIYLFRSCP